MKILDTLLVVAGILVTVLIITMFVSTEHTIQKTQIIEKTNPLYNVQYRAFYLHMGPVNWYTKAYLDKRGVGYGMALYCELNYIQF
jgi:uncharacterized membrane protein